MLFEINLYELRPSKGFFTPDKKIVYQPITIEVPGQVVFCSTIRALIEEKAGAKVIIHIDLKDSYKSYLDGDEHIFFSDGKSSALYGRPNGNGKGITFFEEKEKIVLYGMICEKKE